MKKKNCVILNLLLLLNIRFWNKFRMTCTFILVIPEFILSGVEVCMYREPRSTQIPDKPAYRQAGRPEWRVLLCLSCWTWFSISFLDSEINSEWHIITSCHCRIHTEYFDKAQYKLKSKYVFIGNPEVLLDSGCGRNDTFSEVCHS